ncbi:Hcp family type VI secretion system effector [Xenorhabdus szentirmaii]|uniref:Type VI secretion system effector (Hcp1 family) n=2 Tax=Xenorhabdus szentirmaii TaxID=290112 RepID=W1ISB0_9GAMM|nr:MULTISPECIES: type VI secretion system tube protein Hcp [Xenorhabdus]MBD2779193.1 type VI secretion system tube protein Hcp [Xenorhabdus sp. 38]MBD2792644.1 type VI secretion system tube protein Hcp [Xenorhabdus sp. CUL]MBD2802594.1 type VI secretion system tube protein Hcp [Xenorhabdus sp. M]MBD2805779.1 type VI secretion system tube protein Hcp [Xenorhabdus sp. ZM]MBD2821329.1 type VI secretion system tube protein Hcp [Xenorhabdus sp. 42]
MSTAGIDAYINFTNIKGESADQAYKDWTSVRTFALELSNRVNYENQSSGLGAGIVEVSSLSAELLFDKSAISLRQFIVKGTHIDKVTLNVRRQGGKQEVWYTLVLEHALIAKSLLTYSGGLFYSSISVAFQKHKESYFSQESSGSKGGEVSYEWDSYTNQGG